jgi:hypothetical protein
MTRKQPPGVWVVRVAGALAVALLLGAAGAA